MSGTKNRAGQARALARAMTANYGVPVSADYDPSNRWWVFTWADGPTHPMMMEALTAAGHTFVHPEWRTEVQRGYSDRALTLTAIRMAAAGESFGRHGIYAVQEQHRHTEYPERSDDREAAMADRLMAVASDQADHWGRSYFSEIRMADLVAERGIGWLLEPDPAAGFSQPGVDLTDREAVLGLLTSRYATGQQAEDWKRHGRTMGLREAVHAAAADPGLVDPDLTLALLALVPDFIADLNREALEIKKRAVIAGRRADNSWQQIGTALGTSKQGAQKWATENGVVATAARAPVDPRAAQLATDIKASLDAGATWEEASRHRFQRAVHDLGEQEATALLNAALQLHDEANADRPQ